MSIFGWWSNRFDEDGSSINDYKRTRVVDNQALGILDKLLDMAEEVCAVELFQLTLGLSQNTFSQAVV